ncbi:hypothetical protein AGR4A_Lc120003 [Agrobacterium tumefaciens str. B6]|uniref:Transposase n=1 Tax=Agrobacterium tumefaciens str. B6 TaxID=1183423 RepID=A0A822V7G6_AGRTU|nr:hypothetical protein AGR4A_Lc120003 [Agrobacterium tumefaciens str. B6]
MAVLTAKYATRALSVQFWKYYLYGIRTRKNFSSRLHMRAAFRAQRAELAYLWHIFFRICTYYNSGADHVPRKHCGVR